MDIKEAYTTLEIPDTSSKEEAKKAFKKLAAKLHPDVNKEPDAEEKFKRVNEAQQIIENYDPNAPTNVQWGNVGGIDLSDIISSMGGFPGFGRQKKPVRQMHDIYIDQTISFKENILGSTKEISFECDLRCDPCNGAGSKAINNGCAKCGGKGTIITRQGFAVMHSTCPSCRGKVDAQSCLACSGNGYVSGKKSLSVNIPTGISPDKNVLKLGNVGHFTGDTMLGQSYTAVYLNVKIEQQDGLTLDGDDVITRVSIPLLDALQGTVKSVPTIDGYKDAIIPELTKNGDNVVLPNLGVRRRGNERVIVNVEYPTDTKALAEFLKPSQDNQGHQDREIK
jgi:molecular chaperone DnaJ